MKIRDAVLVLALGMALGFILFDQKQDNNQLRHKVEQREKRIDSLEVLLRQARDSLKIKQRVKIIEKIKYEKIQPRTYSSPELDSLFRARYGILPAQGLR